MVVRNGDDVTRGEDRVKLIGHALQYAARGWRIFPLKPKGKTPLIARKDGGHGFHDATTDHTQIEAWWTACPDANIGLATGSGLVVLDIDGPEGLADLQALVSKHGPLPQTLMARTGNGAHLFFRGEGLRSSARGNLHVRAEGGYVVLAPSIHPSGRPYTWVDQTATLAELSPWLKEHLQNDTGKEKIRTIELQRTDEPSYLSGLSSRNLAARALQAISTAESRYSPGELQRIKSALAVIPSVSYEIWYKVGMILQGLEWVGEGGSDLGLEIWDAWSQRSTEKYPGRGAIETKWGSFGRAGRGGLGLGTLFALAQDHGWQGIPFTEQSQPREYQNGHESVNTTLPPIFTEPSKNSDPPTTLISFYGDDLIEPAPKRQWLVNPWIPAEEVTLLAGDGGTGKSTLALQLALASITNTLWFNLPVKQTNALYVSAEDNRDDVHWRFQEIRKHLPATNEQLHKLKFIDVTQVDPVMVLFGRDGKMIPQAMFNQIEHHATEHQAGLVILDAAADVFGGSEIDRRQVRAFLSSLRALAHRLRIAIVILAHPSVEGMKSERGYSGSTAWNNSVRSRLWFKKFKPGSDEPGDTDMRVLELGKSNRAQSEIKIIMRWTDGRFETATIGMAVSEETRKTEMQTFLELLAALQKQGRETCPKRGPSYAPAMMAKMPKGRELGSKGLERGMEAALAQGLAIVKTEGPPSRRITRIETA